MGSGEEPVRDDVERSAAGLTTAEVKAAQEKWGKNVLEKPEISPCQMLIMQFVGMMPVILILAAILSAATGDWADFAIVVIILIINALLGFREQMEAKKALDELTASVSSEVPARRDGEVNPIDVEELVPGDVILIVGGDNVPADVTWVEGDKLAVDTAALTGEPIPRKYPSDQYGYQILAGCTVAAGEAYCYVDKTGANTELGSSQEEILKDKAGGKTVSVFEQNVMRAVRYLILFSLVLVLIILFVLGFARNQFKKDWREVVLTALSIMIASVPIALPLIIQVTMAIGASGMAKNHGAVVTSSSALQDIAAMTTLCSDKTGTLTTANMSIKVDMAWVAPEVDGTNFPNRTASELLELGRLCSNPDKKDDPIDRAVINAYNEDSGGDEAAKAKLAKRGAVADRVGFDNSAKRMTVTMESGLTIAKGISSKCLDTAAGGEDASALQWEVITKGIEGGLPALTELVEEADTKLSKAGYKTIAVAARSDDKAPFEFLGLLPMIDPPRFDTKRTIANLNRAGVDVKMCTGDHQNIAIETARLIGLNQDIRAGSEIRGGAGPETTADMIKEAGGFAQVLPRDKREVVLTLRNKFKAVVGMTGDGVNDAPALSSAQVGIAVDGATDAAKGAAAIILTTPGLSAIFGGLVESRKIFARLKSYIQYRFAATFHIVIFLTILSLGYNCQLKAIYVILLALFNDLTLTPVSKDYAQASKDPVDTRLWKIIALAGVYACIYVAGSLIYYELATDSSLHLLQRKGKLDFVTREGIHTCTQYVQAAMFLQIGLAAEFLIFSARAPGVWFMSKPSPYLIVSTMVGSITLSLVVRFATGFGELTGRDVIIAWFYSFIVFNIADCAKLLFYAYFHTSSGVIEYHEEEDVEDEDHIEEEHKDMLAGKEGSQHLRPRVSAVPTAAGLQGFLIHGNTQDAGFAYTPGSDNAGE